MTTTAFERLRRADPAAGLDPPAPEEQVTRSVTLTLAIASPS